LEAGSFSETLVSANHIDVVTCLQTLLFVFTAVITWNISFWWRYFESCLSAFW